MAFIFLYWAAFLVFTGVMLPSMLQEADPLEDPFRLFNRLLPVVLLFDFVLRFILQTPLSREIKPYLLFPISKKKLVGTFLLQSGLRRYNLLFFFTFVPFAWLTILPAYGWMSTTTYLVGLWLLMVLNQYGYLLCKMLMSEHSYWFLLPIGFYGTLFAAESLTGTAPVTTSFGELGEGFLQGSPLSYAIVLLPIVLLFWLNRKLQIRLLYTEISRSSTPTGTHLSSYRLLDSFGLLGEFMRLELKLIFRNKATRTQFRFGFFFMVLLSLLLAFTPLYDGEYMVRFIVIYSFAVIGIMTLGKTMCYEGNYLDRLLTLPGTLFPLLRAKYYVNLLFLLLPLGILLFPLLQGKIRPLMALSYLSFTGGFIFFLLLQMAVYNQHTLALHHTVMRNNKSNSLLSTLLIGAALGLPILLDKLLHTLLGSERAYWVLLVIGLFFIFTHLLWIQHLCQRFMRRRYQKIEDFRATL